MPVRAEGQPLTNPRDKSQPHDAAALELGKRDQSMSLQTGNHRPPPEKVAPLIGRKSLLKCSMNGYAVTAMLDTGANVSIIDHTWKNKYLPEKEIRPLSELMDEELSVTAVTGEAVPYDGWMEVVVNLQGNNDPDLSIRVPFLVSRLDLERPLVGFNVIQELIKSNESRPKIMSILVNLLTGALEINSAKAEAIVSFIQTKPKVEQNATVKVGRKGATINPGQVAYIRCGVSLDISDSSPLVLFEPNLDDTPLLPLSIGEGLLAIQQDERPFVKVPVSNHSTETVVLPSSTVLGTIEAIDGVIGTGSPSGEHSQARGNTDSPPSPMSDLPPTILWHPPVDVSHLSDEQQRKVKQMLYEESGAFACDDEDIGCIPSCKCP